MFSILLPGNPVPFTPSKLVCVGRNFAQHVREIKAEVPQEPVLFLKPSSAIIRAGSAVTKPFPYHDLHYEVEMTVLVGRRGSRIRESEALDYVAGLGVGLDMTLRDLQSAAKSRGLPWSAAKGFDTSAPLSDFVPVELASPRSSFRIELKVNGSVRQKASTRDFLFPLERLIAHASAYFTLERGDVIFTGTPEGVGSVASGDLLQASLSRESGETLATLTVHVL